MVTPNSFKLTLPNMNVLNLIQQKKITPQMQIQTLPEQDFDISIDEPEL